MARAEPSNINYWVAPARSSPINSLTKGSIQRGDEIKSEFTLREGTYKISSLIDHTSKSDTKTCLNESVKLTLLPRMKTISDTNTYTSSRCSSLVNNHNSDEQRLLSNDNDLNQTNRNRIFTDILAFNIGRELIIYEFTEVKKVKIF